MLSIDPNTQTERQNYGLLTGSVVPRPIAFITSVAEDGTINGAPFSYFSIVSAEPPLVSVAVQRKAGTRKDTARNIIGKSEFVIHVVDEDNVEQINQTAASLPPHQSELEVAQLTMIQSEAISVPGIKEAKVRMECVLENALEIGKDGEVTADLLIGRIVRFHIDEDCYQDGGIYPEKLKAVSRLAGPMYAKVGDTFQLERPI